jgi:hypothetical protein
LKVEGVSTTKRKKEKKMKNLEIDFQFDDIFEIESLIDDMNLPDEPLLGIEVDGREWKSTLKKYVYGTIDKVQYWEYEAEQALWSEESDDYVDYDDLDEESKEYYDAQLEGAEEERRILEKVLTNYFSK